MLSNVYASLVLLSYNRPQMTAESLISLKQSLDFPAEIIVVDDGSSHPDQLGLLGEVFSAGQVSKMVLTRSNQGVGEAVRMGFGVASGRYLFKLDSDLHYERGWLSEACSILEYTPSVGMIGFFRYWTDPVDHRKMKPVDIPLLEECNVRRRWCTVEDFVSSAFGIHRDLWLDYHEQWETGSEAFAEDVAFKRFLREQGFSLIIPSKDDLIHNVGFGLERSVVVESQNGVPQVHRINKFPLVFGVNNVTALS